MKTLKKFFLIFLLIGMNSVLLGQNDCACCQEVNHQFDFWLGEWVVKNDQGQVVGENSISKIEDNCILVEQWKGAKGTTGTSHNYYDSSDQTWNQLWIDNKGNILKLKGHLIDKKMVLKSERLENKEGQPFFNQITWSAEADGSVLQLWEILDAKGQVLNTAFKGHYFKKD